MGYLLTTGSEAVYSRMFLLLKADPELNFLQRFEVGFGSEYDLLLEQLQAPAEIRASFC